jgi:spore germination protein YaaH
MTRKAWMAALGGLLLAQGAHTSDRTTYNTWVVYWDGSNSVAAARDNLSAWEEVAVFAADFDSKYQFSISPWVHQTLHNLRQADVKTPLLLTVVNDVRAKGKAELKSPHLVHELISEPEDRTRHIQELVEATEAADGLEIDYEALSLRDREYFSVFVQELSEKLRARKKKLVVIVEPKTSDVRRDKAGAIDWEAVGQSADVVK